jgi:(p)ppGpp synthase/HD superfamily hydrolase
VWHSVNVVTDHDRFSEPSFVRDLPLTLSAIEFARERHGEQRRDGDGAPFLLHPLEVASLLERSEYPDYVVAAAVLHDVLEDTDAVPEEIRERFGKDVCELVAVVSDDASVADEEERKDRVRERVRATGGYAPAVYAADKVSKVRELRMLLASGLDLRAAATKLARYRKSLEMLEQTIPGSRVVELLRFELEALEQLPPAQVPAQVQVQAQRTVTGDSR